MANGADAGAGAGAARDAVDAALATVARHEAGRLTAALTRVLGDFDVAEELVQDAILVALQRWPASGVPADPAAWLFTTARRRAIDLLRRDRRYREKLRLLEETTVTQGSAFPDERLELIFTCCHPALARDARLALTLRSVGGLTTAQIARAFLTSESAIAQRIVRAKRKIVEARIPLRVPEEHERPGRLHEVLTVLYLLFNEGYLASGGAAAQRRDLAEEAEWLASLVARLMPGEPEVLGLLALMRLALARADARFDADGHLVLLRDQDRGRWDRARIASAREVLAEAGRVRRPGPYQLQAAIAACHTDAASHEETDWPQILALYDALVSLEPTPVARLNRAIALRYATNAAAALRETDRLGPELERYPYFHAARAELLRDLGRADEAREADRRALTLTDNPAERELLLARLA